MKTKILMAVGCAVLLTACEKKAETKVAPVVVKTMPVVTSSEASSHSYVGTVEEQYGSSLSFASAGTVSSVRVNEGQAVSKGQVLATLDQTQVKNAYSVAASMLAQAKDAFARMDELYKKGSLPEIKYVEIQTKLAEAEASERMAKKAIQDCVLTAPFSGFISSRTVDVGQNVMPGVAAFKLVKLAQVDVKVPVPEKEIASVRVGQTMAFTVSALGDRRFVGKVTKKGVQANSLSHTYDVMLTVSNGDRALLPGMVCSVEAETSGAKGNIVVPQEAVLTDGTDRFVWLVEGTKAHRQKVETDGVTAQGVVIKGGLAVGNKLIVAGQNKVSEGMTVKEN